MKAGPSNGLHFRMAAAAGDIKRLEELYKLKPGLLNLTGQPSGCAAIHQAAAKGQVQAVQWLLNHGADYQLEEANGKNAIEIALQCNQFAVFACFYNHQNKQQAPLYTENPLFTSRTSRFKHKPLIIATGSNENIIGDLMNQPGFIFSEYATIAQYGIPHVRTNELPSHVSIHNLNLQCTYPLSAEQQAHPDFIDLQYHHAAVRIAELAEKVEGGIVVFVNNDINQLLTKLNQVYPNVDKLFEPFMLPGAQFNSPATSSVSRLVQPSQMSNIDQIRERTRDLARSSFEWDNIAKAGELFINALCNFERILKSERIHLEKMSRFASSASSSSDSAQILPNFMDPEFSFTTAKQLVRDYFKLANLPESPEKSKLLHEIMEQFFPIYYKFKQNPYNDDSILLLCAFYFTVKGELFSAIDFNHDESLIFKSLAEDMLDVAVLSLNFQHKNTFERLPILSKMLSFSIKRSRAQLYLINPEYGILEEFQCYIDLKNAQPYATANIELLFSWTEENIKYKPGEALIRLANRIKEGLQDRTQVIYFADPNHAMLIDIAWDKIDQQFKCIFVESSTRKRSGINLVMSAFHSQGIKARFICLAKKLQRDYVSCLNYALIFSTMTSHLTFDELSSHGAESKANVQYLPISLLGDKTILMDQSSSAMRERLTALNEGNSQIADDKIKKWKIWYGETATGKTNYIAYRRQSLYNKVMITKKHYTTKEILEVTGVDDIGASLRQLAAGVGPGCMLSQLLSQLSQKVINETGSSSGKSSLHFAYKFKRHGRVARLLAYGADTELKDHEGKRPREYKAP